MALLDKPKGVSHYINTKQNYISVISLSTTTLSQSLRIAYKEKIHLAEGCGAIKIRSTEKCVTQK